ncbi:MAG: hypothetical protein ACRBCK_03075 [Alphaproteobacteria bacterium]
MTRNLKNSSSKQRKPSYFLYGVSVGVICIAIGSGYIYYDHQQKTFQAQQEQIRIDHEAKEKQRLEVQELSKQYLSDFVQELKTHAISYKKRKRVLKEMISPYNFETPEYSKENYDIFMKEVAPSLRNESNNIIQVFDTYTSKVQDSIQETDSDTQQYFIKEWSDMSTNQLSQYVDFFSQEEKLLQAYEELIRFYYIHSNLFTVDVESNVFKFKRDKDKIKQAELLKNIATLQFSPRAATKQKSTSQNSVEK